MQSLTKELLLGSVCAMGNWNWERRLSWKFPGRTRNPQNIKVVKMSYNLFSIVLRADSSFHVKEAHYGEKEGVRWMLSSNHAGFTLRLFSLLARVSLFQRMCATSSARPQCITTFPSTGTVSSSDCTSAMKETRTSATQSSPSSCRYTFHRHLLKQNLWAAWLLTSKVSTS